MLRASTVLFAAAVLSAASTAQTYFYVPSNTPSTGTCNVIPWGTTNTSSTWRNQRYQTIVTNQELGGGNAPITISSLAFAPCGIQVHTAESLRITMAQVTAPVLSTTFADNLANHAQVVLDAGCHHWRTQADAWSDVGLERPYEYVPSRGNLVIEIIVTGNHKESGGGTGFHRTNDKQRVFAFSWSGDAPATGRTDHAALKMRLGSGVLANRGGFVDTRVRFRSQAQLEVHHRIQGPPNAAAVMLLGLRSSPLPTPLGTLHLDPNALLVTGVVALDSQGSGSATLNLPAFTLPAGLHVGYQGLTVSGGVASFTCLASHYRYYPGYYLYGGKFTDAESRKLWRHPVEAYHVWRCKDDAVAATRRNYKEGGHNDEADAFRHAYWNCCMAKKIGAASAKAWADAHEDSPGNPAKEKAMDLHNNDIGRKLATEPETVLGGERRDWANKSCEELVKEAIKQGKLQTGLK